MKRIILTIVLLTGFALNLMAVPAAPYLITFAQPDGSTFLAHLRGEFALLKRDDKNHLKLAPSGIAVIKRGQSSLRSSTKLPDISREQLGEIWQSRIAEKRKIMLIPKKNSP